MCVLYEGYSWLLFMVFSKKIEKYASDSLTKWHTVTTEGILTILHFQSAETHEAAVET